MVTTYFSVLRASWTLRGEEGAWPMYLPDDSLNLDRETAQSRRLLLVDDELHIVRAAEFKLKRYGYDVMCASDGEAAWERIQSDRPDLVVTDLQMPRLSGLGLIQRLRGTAEFVDLPVVMLTAKGFEVSTDEMANQLGVLDIVTKPFSPRELCKRVQMALEESDRRKQFATRNQSPAP